MFSRPKCGIDTTLNKTYYIVDEWTRHVEHNHAQKGKYNQTPLSPWIRRQKSPRSISTSAIDASKLPFVPGTTEGITVVLSVFIPPRLGVTGLDDMLNV